MDYHLCLHIIGNIYCIMIIFIVHNVVALFSELYSTNSSLVYGSFGLIMLLTYFGYIKIKKNHDTKHKIFQEVYTITKKMLEDGIKSSKFTYNEAYES